MLITLLRYILGYVRFSVSGDFPERLFNQLAANGVSVWDMRREGKCMTACVKVRDYKKMRRYKGRNKVRIRATERCGLPFFMHRYRLRVGFAAGVIVYAAALVFLSGHIWNVKVVGLDRISEPEILNALSELGLHEGVPISSVDPEVLRTRLALKVDGIAWASVNIEGARATVNISESIGTKKTDRSPCDLVASTDGVITAIEVTNGNILVKVGQTVAAGDVLVSGITEYKDGSTFVGRSSGKIYASTEHTISRSAPLEREVTVGTGRVKTRRVLSFFGIDIPLYLGSLDGEYVASKNVKRFESNGMYIPVMLTETTFCEVEKKTVTVDTETARQMALEMLAAEEGEQLKNAEILSREVSFTETDGGVTAVAKYSCPENIANVDLLLIYEEK